MFLIFQPFALRQRFGPRGQKLTGSNISKCLDRGLCGGLCGSCKNVCTGRPLAVFGHFSKGVQGRKKASRPQPPARFDPRGFFSKKAYPYKHPKTRCLYREAFLGPKVARYKHPEEGNSARLLREGPRKWPGNGGFAAWMFGPRRTG